MGNADGTTFRSRGWFRPSTVSSAFHAAPIEPEGSGYSRSVILASKSATSDPFIVTTMERLHRSHPRQRVSAKSCPQSKSVPRPGCRHDSPKARDATRTIAGPYACFSTKGRRILPTLVDSRSRRAPGSGERVREFSYLLNGWPQTNSLDSWEPLLRLRRMSGGPLARRSASPTCPGPSSGCLHRSDCSTLFTSRRVPPVGIPRCPCEHEID